MSHGARKTDSNKARLTPVLRPEIYERDAEMALEWLKLIHGYLADWRDHGEITVTRFNRERRLCEVLISSLGCALAGKDNPRISSKKHNN